MPRVLIVDDEPQYGVFLRDWLTREGHEVKTATTAEAAVDFGTSWLPCVLIADWMLRSPLDGLQVSEAVRAANPNLQTILITGYPSQELKDRAAEANVFSFIEKPFSLTEVAGAVRQATCVVRPQLPGSVLVVSSSQTVAKLAYDTLRAAGYTPHVVSNGCEAKQVLQSEPDVSVAILDGLVADIDHGLLADELRAVQPGLTIVGSSEGDDRQDFAELGITWFLPRFWQVGDLHDLLIRPIDACPRCGESLPLRQPLLCEEPRQFICTNCEERIVAVLRSDARDEICGNVQEDF
ncbi:MAG TPA: response regulator [Pirellulales bacterium]|nr:response regulator [Pirellulales bacterium]